MYHIKAIYTKHNEQHLQDFRTLKGATQEFEYRRFLMTTIFDRLYRGEYEEGLVCSVWFGEHDGTCKQYFEVRCDRDGGYSIKAEKFC